MDPITLGLILAVIPVIYQAATDLRDGPLERIGERRRAANALSFAVSQTESYLEHLRGGGTPNRNLESQLGVLWDEAYGALLPFYDDDRRRIEPLRLKALYWDAPDTWSDDGADAASIVLSTIRETLRRFIRNAPTPHADAE